MLEGEGSESEVSQESQYRRAQEKLDAIDRMYKQDHVESKNVKEFVKHEAKGKQTTEKNYQFVLRSAQLRNSEEDKSDGSESRGSETLMDQSAQSSIYISSPSRPASGAEKPEVPQMEVQLATDIASPQNRTEHQSDDQA